jgi:hypothetical protein
LKLKQFLQKLLYQGLAIFNLDTIFEHFDPYFLEMNPFFVTGSLLRDNFKNVVDMLADFFSRT